jgi:hypothetical protein
MKLRDILRGRVDKAAKAVNLVDQIQAGRFLERAIVKAMAHIKDQKQNDATNLILVALLTLQIASVEVREEIEGMGYSG